MLKQLDKAKQKKTKNLDPYLILYTKINSKQIIEFNVKSRMIKFLEEKIENFCDLGPSKKFLGKTLKAPKEKLINWISSE